MMLAAFFYNFPIIGNFLRYLYNEVGVTSLAIITGSLLFIVYFFLISQKSISYLEEISNGIKKVAQGEFDSNIPIKSNDELGILANNINIMSRQLRKSIEEERNAEKSKNELVTSVSHDLRTPLTSILGYLGLIANDNYRDEVALRHYVDIAYDKASHLKNLIDELFEYTKVSYGGMKVNFIRVNLVELLEQLVEDFAPLLQQSGMTCRIATSHKEIYTLIDPNLMVRVFENLITNAIRYGKEGKYIDVEVIDKNDSIIKIANYGNPIPSADLPYIFERFYRVEKSRSQDSGGTGLGLAIAKSIVELHKGEIKAISNKERTIFEIKLIKQ